ncbi:hypothetical protein ES703_07281 [subsurface metagenome]
MAPPKKLVCDRCGLELTNKDDIELALEGAEAWQAAVWARGDEPRGLFPCENYKSCGGEMKPFRGKGIFRRGGNTN